MTTYSSFRPQTQNLVITGDTTLGDASGDTITVNGSTLNLAASASRIRGDFTNATLANRVAFQTSTTNGTTTVAAIPNGTGVTSQLQIYNNSDLANSSRGSLLVNATETRLISDITGTGTYLPLTMYTNGSERLRIDTSGNIGIGVSTVGTNNRLSVQGVVGISGSTNGTAPLPSAAHVSSSTIRLGLRGSVMTSDEAGLTAVGTYLSNNVFFRNASGNPGYITASSVSQIALIDDTITFRRASSGTADTDITFTETMRINSSGNVGIGTNNPGYKLDVYDASTAYSALRGDSNTQFVVSRASTDNTGGFVQFYKARGTQASPTIVASGDIAGRMVFYGYDGTSFTGTAEIRATIDGTPGANDMPGRLGFYTTPDGSTSLTERMRIDSSGNLLVGTTSTNFSTGNGAIVGATGRFLGTCTNDATIAGARLGTDGNVAAWYKSTTLVGQISVTASSCSFTNLSDYRVKENVTPLTNALSKVSKLKPCTYTFTLDGAAGEGFIAHELAEVCPQAVTGEKDAVDKDGKPVYQGVDTSFLIATLTAAIQEQQVLIQNLTSRLNALEGN
jgi:hypothetical protein